MACCDVLLLGPSMGRKWLAVAVPAWRSVGAEPGTRQRLCTASLTPYFGSGYTNTCGRSLQTPLEGLRDFWRSTVHEREKPCRKLQKVTGIWDQPHGCWFHMSGQPTICFIPWGTSVRSSAEHWFKITWRSAHAMLEDQSMNYPLVNCYIAIEHGHRNSGFSH